MAASFKRCYIRVSERAPRLEIEINLLVYAWRGVISRYLGYETGASAKSSVSLEGPAI